MVNQDAPDNLRTKPEELKTVVTVDSAAPDQLQICLIHKSRGFQRMVGNLPAKVPSCDLPKLRVNHRHKVTERLLIAVAPGREQSSDVMWTLNHDGSKL